MLPTHIFMFYNKNKVLQKGFSSQENLQTLYMQRYSLLLKSVKIFLFLDSKQQQQQQQGVNKMSMSSESRQNQLLSLISATDLSSYYGIAIAGAVVAGSALYYYVKK